MPYTLDYQHILCRFRKSLVRRSILAPAALGPHLARQIAGRDRKVHFMLKKIAAALSIALIAPAAQAALPIYSTPGAPNPTS